ncbi:MAG TPA: hypothetical protein DCR55_13460, partial [Lentisphaeria bacterium]|nr:hypothetical protein [Lentisphaeria bacterium]
MILAIAIAVLSIVGLGVAALLIKNFYRKVAQGQALIINQISKIIVSFKGGIVIPIVHKAEYMDISVKAMEVDRRGKEGLICQDNIRADITVSFYVRVNPTEDDVKKVAAAVGCARASNRETLQELFSAKFSEALKTVGKAMQFTDLFTERDTFKEKIIDVIGTDLNGYALEDVAIDYLEQTPKSDLDPDNILDAEGIRKITNLTSQEAIKTNEFERNKERVIKKEDVETRERILALERQEEDAVARQHREIETIQAREAAEAEKVKAEERLKAERARIKTDEELAVATENKDRQIEVAIKNRERTIAVETERVQRDQELEMTERERQVAIKQIEKDKALEQEKKEIAEVIRERVAIEKTVAEQEEKILDTRAFAGADRQRRVEVTAAEEKADAELVGVTKAAEAKELAAKSEYRERETRAGAEMVEAEKQAEAVRIRAEKEAESKKLLAEGVIAEEAASGLAQVKIREAEAHAIEVTGKAEAGADLDRRRAEAQGIELEGTAEAVAFAAKGKAEAEAMDAKFTAEAVGIDKKAEAMKNFDSVGREHEEFKLELEKEKEIELAQIDVDRQIAAYQSEIMGESMKQANIDIVGGGGEFLDKFFKSITLAKTVDGFVEHSEVVQRL